MRWRSNRPFSGEQRVRTGFLWLPKRAGYMEGETRWLETAAWVEQYTRLPGGWFGWKVTSWIE